MTERIYEEIAPEAVDIIYKLSFKTPMDPIHIEEFGRKFPQVEGLYIPADELGLSDQDMESISMGVDLDQDTRIRYAKAVLGVFETHGVDPNEVVDFIKSRIISP